MARRFCYDRSEDHRSQARAEAQVLAARTGVAVELFRRKHGRYPDSLNELVPGVLPVVPVDPFDGQMLRYIHDDELVITYSIGHNLVDDGGSKEESWLSSAPEDVVFTLRWPAPIEESGDGE